MVVKAFKKAMPDNIIWMNAIKESPNGIKLKNKLATNAIIKFTIMAIKQVEKKLFQNEIRTNLQISTYICHSTKMKNIESKPKAGSIIDSDATQACLLTVLATSLDSISFAADFNVAFTNCPATYSIPNINHLSLPRSHR